MLRPTAFARSLAEVSIEALRSQGVRGLMLDLDNTLVAFDQAEPHPEFIAWIHRAQAAGMRLVLVSNNFGPRARGIAGLLGIACVPNALKPLPSAFGKALALLGTPKDATMVIGDQLFTDVLGARFFGLRCILTEPLANRDFITTRILRFFERLVLLGVRR